VELTQRNLTIIASSIVLGLGVEVQSDALAQFPDDLQVLLGSGLLVGGVTALVLNARLSPAMAASRRPTPALTLESATVLHRWDSALQSASTRRYGSRTTIP